MKITSLSLLAVALLSAHVSGKLIRRNLFGIAHLYLDYNSGVTNGNVEYSIALTGGARANVKQWSLTFEDRDVNFYVDGTGRIGAGPISEVCRFSHCLFDEHAGPDPQKAFTGKEKAPGNQAALDSFMASSDTYISIAVHFEDGTFKSALIDQFSHN